MKDELYNMYQQIIIFMKNIINIIELNKVDDNNFNEEGDNELQKYLCYIWDITCQEENAKLVVNCIETSISIFLKLMTSTKLERTQELCLGILGNIACFESLYSSLYENDILISILGLTFSTSMDPEVLFSCCRLMKNLIIGFCKMTYIHTNTDFSEENKDNILCKSLHFHKAFLNSFQTYNIYKKFFFILENSLHNNLLKEVLDIIYLLYSTIFLKEYFIFYTIDELSVDTDTDDIKNDKVNEEKERENEKLKKAQYHLDVYKTSVNYLYKFIHTNLSYLNHIHQQKNTEGIVKEVKLEKSENDKEKNKSFFTCKLFFDSFESKSETVLSLLRIAYTLIQNSNFLMTDELITKNLIIVILEWIYLYSRDLSYEYKEYEYFEHFDAEAEEQEEERIKEEDPFLLDNIVLSFKIIECYIQNHHSKSDLQELFFHSHDRRYSTKEIIKCLIYYCLPKETGWKILHWISEEIKNMVQDLNGNLLNIKNNNTKLVIQSILLNNYEVLDELGENLSIRPKIQDQERIGKNLRDIVYIMFYYSPFYSKGIEQDAEESYGDLKQRYIQERLYQLVEILVKTNPSLKDDKLKWVKDIIYDAEIEKDYNEKAKQLETLIINTCSSILSLKEIYNELKSNDQENDVSLNDEPIIKLLCNLWRH